MKSVLDEEQAKKIIGEKYSHLTQGQSDAVVHILSSQDRVIGIQGDAGTGKTTMLQDVREQFENHGYYVQGLSYTGKAAAQIEKNSGIRSQTLHSFLSALESRNKVGGNDFSREHQVWIIDEASMI